MPIQISEKDIQDLVDLLLEQIRKLWERLANSLITTPDYGGDSVARAI